MVLMMTSLMAVGTREIPKTINIHLTRRCNLGCNFCYAQFAESNSGQMPPATLRRILETIGAAPPSRVGRRRKVNFAGGEPLLYANLAGMVEFSKGLGLVTSIVTNGSLLTGSTLSRLAGALDICAISLDSGSPETNKAIGRFSESFQPDAQFYLTLGGCVKTAGIRLKINTVVNRHNLAENLGGLVSDLQPFRWKLFQVKKVIGQNHENFDDLANSTAEFEDFVMRNRRRLAPGITMVPETARTMSGSYAMIAPNGCFFDSAAGFHRYSRPILDVGVAEAFQDVAFDADKFVNRGGSYE
jgi:radical S-adenosyl methionine domain-containing protein 2